MNLQLQGVGHEAPCSPDLELTDCMKILPCRGGESHTESELRHLVGFFLLAGIPLPHPGLQPRYGTSSQAEPKWLPNT